jgi:putative Holliday junction resolvase
MKIMGIDYGTKRVGVAFSDEGMQFAIPSEVIKNSKTLLSEIKEIADKNYIKEIVMGESKNYKGEANDIYEESLKFKADLEKEGFKVHLEPEFMTSVNAERFQGKNDMLDASAAALILQSFLDKKQSKV